MALTSFQLEVCRLLAENRRRSGESYVAGGATLNELLRAPRRSRDIDLFHDTQEALEASWSADRSTLDEAGYELRVLRERPTFIEAQVRRHREAVIVQWAQDSAYRFFPLVEHEDLGLTLHPFDLATSKVLALVGRVEPRDFVDALTCDQEIQPLGYLAWAACGKDPGFSPSSIVELAARAAHYAPAELDGLDFDGDRPDPRELSRRWHGALDTAREIVSALPADDAGQAVLDGAGAPYRGSPAQLASDLADGTVLFHAGSIRGAFPRILR